MLGEIKSLGDSIVRTHDGRTFFNLSEACEIIGCGPNTLPALLHAHGIAVKKVGPSKRINAYDIAEVMCSKRIAPIDNTTRCTTTHREEKRSISGHAIYAGPANSKARGRLGRDH